MLWRDKVVRIFDKEGRVVREIPLPEDIVYVKKRLSKGLRTGLYYKGAGCLYQGHYVLQTGGYEVIGKADVDYCGWLVVRKEWVGKFGIFQERYQPYFSDWIGGCGKKERRIVKHSERFGRSGVRVEDVIEIGDEHAIYVVRYLYSRTGMVKLEGLMKTLTYALKEDWNFPWDKNVLGDVDDEGCVVDVADLFRAGDLVSKFGTVYAVFYSIMQDGRLKKEFFERYRVELREELLPFAVYAFLRRVGVDISEIGEVRVGRKDYERLMRDYVIAGKSCAGLEDDNWENIARRYYLEKLERAMRNGE